MNHIFEEHLRRWYSCTLYTSTISYNFRYFKREKLKTTRTQTEKEEEEEEKKIYNRYQVKERKANAFTLLAHDLIRYFFYLLFQYLLD